MRYQKTIARLHALVDDQVVPGVSYTIFDGEEKTEEVFGASQLQPTTQPLWQGALYDVASLTKVVGTTTVMMQLVQDGKLPVDDEICRYLPTFGDERVTIRHLMTHTSGITGYIPNRNQLRPDQLTQALLGLHVGEDFNQRVKYADIGFIYLGWIIEHFYHRPVQQVIQEAVLTPLGMDQSTFQPIAAQCVPTEIQPQRGLIRGSTHDPKGYILGEHCGCAGLFSSLSDLTRFGQAMVTDNLAGILTNETMDHLFVDQTPMPGYHGRSFGWRVLPTCDNQPHMVIYHTGYTGTWMILDRQTKQGFIMLSNRVHPSANNPEFIERRHQLVQTYLQEK